MLTDEISDDHADEVIDEDLEALLYAQLYYGKPEWNSLAEPDLLESLQVQSSTETPDLVVDENSSSSLSSVQEPVPNIDPGSYKSNIKKSKTQSHYLQNFSNQESEEEEEIDVGTNIIPDPVPKSTPAPQYVEISTTSDPSSLSPTQVVTQIPVLSTPNNITINQYFYPNNNFLKSFNQLKKGLKWTNKCEQHYQRLQEGLLEPKTFLGLLRKQARSQKKQAKKYAKLQEKIQLSKAKLVVKEVICLSDSDNSDIEIVEGQDMQPDDKNDDGDDIIYVEPPPVPVIVVEDDKEEHIDVVTCSPQDDASNDFLGPANTNDKENFNFSLHGSDFQEAEFVRPANPIADVYENESSTSTSDLNRESFVNSVKTIVFSEVDFPKDDIFEGGNLEKFDDLITPRREVAVEAAAPKEKSAKKTLSESSSESDYDYSESLNKNLPDLSPMISIPKSSKKQEEDLKIRKSKRKSAVEPVTPKRNSKKKKKEGEEIAQSETKKKSKKPKRKQVKELEDDVITKLPETEDDSGKKKSKKKKRDKQKTVEEDNNSVDEETLKKKGRRRKQREEEEAQLEQAEEGSTSSSSSSKTRRKKRASEVPDVAKEVEVEEELSGVEIEKVQSTTKAKRKKRASELPDVGKEVEVEEESSVPNMEVENSSKTKRKKRASLDNSTTEVPDLGKEAEEEEVASVVNVEVESSPSSDSSKTKRKKRASELPDVGKEAEEEEINVEVDNSPSSSKTKRKKRASLDNSTTEVLDVGKEVEVEDDGSDVDVEKVLEPPYVPKRPEGKVVVEEHSAEEGGSDDESQEEEDIVLIEPVVPVHTIESSDSEDDDILTFEDLTDELVLNVETTSEPASPKPVEELVNEEFDVETLKKNMPDDPDKWQVLMSDIRCPPEKNKIKRRCRRCRQMGHLALYCTNKSSIPVCSLCGQDGHEEPRCPNKVCLSCGHPGRFSLVYCYKCADKRNKKCDICHLQGHTSDLCPDTWRRYYLTTEEGPLVKPQNKKHLRPVSERWCSGCASKGHLEHECRSYKWIREYPAASPRISSFQDVYSTNKSPKKSDPTLSPADLRNKITSSRPRSEPESTITSQQAAEAAEPAPPGTLDFVPPPPPPPQRSKRERVNPFSVMRNQPSSRRFTPYQSVLNPGATDPRNTPPFTFSGTPSITDFEMPYSAQSTSQNQLSLYNSVPPQVVAQQVSNLWSSVHQVENMVTSYQTNYGGGGEYNYTQDSYYGRTDQFEQQRLPSLTHYGEQHSRVNFGSSHQLSQIQSNYIDFSSDTFTNYGPPPVMPPPPPPPPSHPYTLSREPTRANANARAALVVVPNNRTTREPPVESFISLEVTAQNQDKNWPVKLNNVEEVIKQKFASLSVPELVEFLQSEIQKLQDIKPPEIRMFKKRLNGLEQVKCIEVKTNSVKKQIYFYFKRMNMYLFGVRQLDNGKKHLDFLRNFIHNGGRNLPQAKRVALLDAYGYIFGGEHMNLNYADYLKKYVPTRFE